MIGKRAHAMFLLLERVAAGGPRPAVLIGRVSRGHFVIAHLHNFGQPRMIRCSV